MGRWWHLSIELAGSSQREFQSNMGEVKAGTYLLLPPPFPHVHLVVNSRLVRAIGPMLLWSKCHR